VKIARFARNSRDFDVPREMTNRANFAQKRDFGPKFRAIARKIARSAEIARNSREL
jgi:hypothetical protein